MELLNTCTWEYCLSIMKVKVRTMDFSVPNAGHVKISRNGRNWQVPLLKIRYVDTRYSIFTYQ